jgi:Tfp pilus assembly protein PilO
MSTTAATFIGSLRKVSGRARKIELRPYEVAAVMLLVLAVVALGIYYFVLLGPERDRVTKLRSIDKKNAEEIKNLQKSAGEIKDPNAQVKIALASLEKFGSLLPNQTTGGTAILREINELARKNKIGITDGLKFTKIEEAPINQTVSEKREGASIYPGLSLDLGVQGKYDDLRAFINDVEHSKNFLVLNAIQLQGIEPQNMQRGGVRTTTRGPKVVGPIETIALRLKLDAYFKR